MSSSTRFTAIWGELDAMSKLFDGNGAMQKQIEEIERQVKVLQIMSEAVDAEYKTKVIA